MTLRDGRAPREPMTGPDADGGRRADGYRRSGRYGRGPGDQRRYERYGDQRSGLGGILRFLVFLLVLATVVLVVMATVARPLVRMIVVPWAEGNSGALHLSFVADLVREDLGSQLTAPAGTDPTVVEFVVQSGDTPVSLAPRLADAGIITSRRAFLFEARMDDLTPQLTAGTFSLAKDLTPAQVVQGLVHNRVIVQVQNVTFREGLRIEQMTAKLETLVGTSVDPKAFYDLAMHPTDALLADYPWLMDPKVRARGSSLEGFLYPATYPVRTDPIAPTSAEGLIRQMLDAFNEKVGADRLAVPAKRGLTFQQVLVLASIVEQEATLDVERPLIAGVYQNRLTAATWPTGLLGSDPTIFYVNDTLELAKLPFDQWTQFAFWSPLKALLPVPLPAALAGYNTYTSKGLPPGPICSPALASIDAALNPNTGTGYLYFVAKGDGSGTTAFAKTLAQHNANVAKYTKH